MKRWWAGLSEKVTFEQKPEGSEGAVLAETGALRQSVRSGV